MQRVHFHVGIGVFNCQQILTKIYFVIFDIVVKKNQKPNGMWFSVVCTLIDNNTGHTVVKFCYETISSSDTSTKRETATLISPHAIKAK